MMDANEAAKMAASLNHQTIPADIRETVSNIEFLLEEDFSEEATDMIEKAILAERRRKVDAEEEEAYRRRTPEEERALNVWWRSALDRMFTGLGR